jgi:DNA-binding NarL/FixJ family response regulator
MPENKITVLVVDDHPMFRRGVIEAIGEGSSLEVVGEAGSGREALPMVGELTPTVVVIDVDMPDMDGLETAKRLLERNPSQKIVLLTMHRDARIFEEAIETGVTGYIVKDETVEGIVEGITCAADGRSYLSPSLAELVMKRGRVARAPAGHLALAKLTATERSVLTLVARNLTSREIASELSISPLTVGTHRSHISKKLGLSGRMPLVNFALLHREEILQEQRSSE